MWALRLALEPPESQCLLFPGHFRRPSEYRFAEASFKSLSPQLDLVRVRLVLLRWPVL